MADPVTGEGAEAAPAPQGSLPAALFALAIAVTAGAAAVAALEFPVEAAIAPITIGVPTCALALVVLARQVPPLLRGRGAAPAGRRADWRADPYLWLAGYAALFALGGAVVALAGFSIGLTRVRGGQSWKASLMYTAVITVAFYLLVEVGLEERLFRGLLLESATG